MKAPMLRTRIVWQYFSSKYKTSRKFLEEDRDTEIWEKKLRENINFSDWLIDYKLQD